MTVRMMNALLLALMLLLQCLGIVSAWVGRTHGVVVIGTAASRRTRTITTTSVVRQKWTPALPPFALDATSSEAVVERMEGPTTTLVQVNNTGVGNVERNEIINATMMGEKEILLLVESSGDFDQSLIASSNQQEEPPQNEIYTYEQKFTNLVVLSIAFGYAFYTILSIDGGMTRGWSASEIAMRIPLDNWGAYESYLANKPILTKSLINVIIYLLGDWLSQTAFTKTNNLLEFDLQRTLRNGFIGLCFGPLVHEYYEFSDAILPPENGLWTRLQKIFMDQTVYLTIKCSLYIGAVGLLAGEDRKTVWQTIQDKIGGIVVTAWKFWPIVHCVTYSVIPAQHRVLWVNSVDLVWNAILSSAAQKGDETETEGTTVAAAESRSEASVDEAASAAAPLPASIDLQHTPNGTTQTNTTANTDVAWVAT